MLHCSKSLKPLHGLKPLLGNYSPPLFTLSQSFKFATALNKMMSVSKNKRNVSCLSFFRVNASRKGVIRDTSCNFTCRAYFIKNEKFSKYKLSELQPILFAKHINIICTGMFNGTFEVEELADKPVRAQVFFHPDDEYFSIVVGWKFPKTTLEIITNNEIRFYVGLACVVNNLNFLCAGSWKTEEATSLWDKKHCDEAPLFDLNKLVLKDLMDQYLKEVKNEITAKSKAKKSTNIEPPTPKAKAPTAKITEYVSSNPPPDNEGNGEQSSDNEGDGEQSSDNMGTGEDQVGGEV